MELIRILLFPAFAIACAIYCGRLARAKGRNAGIWGVAGLLTQLLAVILLHILKARTRLCPKCSAQFVPGIQACLSCGSPLPDAYALTRLVSHDRIYEAECESCGTPYARSDYRPDALEWHCSRCHEALPRRLS